MSKNDKQGILKQMLQLVGIKVLTNANEAVTNNKKHKQTVQHFRAILINENNSKFISLCKDIEKIIFNQ